MMNILFYFLIGFLIFNSKVYSYEDQIERRLNLWPFIVYTKNKLYNIERLEIAGPFIYKYSFPKENGTSIRPFYSSVKFLEGQKVFFISPLGIYKSDNETASFKLIPLINKTWTIIPEEKREEKHFDFFPIFWGETSKNETYGGFFPIYGKFKNRFGKKEISFILWPFYTKVKYFEDYTAKNYLWPFIRILKEENKKEVQYSGFKIWPFYGHFKEGEKERNFIIWPFYIKESFKSSEGDFSEKLSIFPFYIKEDTESYNKKIILWPFFQKIYAKNYFYRQLDAPWPFYRKIEGEEISGSRIWPFYGFLKKSDSLDYFILWPFYSYKEDIIEQNNLIFNEREHHFLIFSKYKYTLQTDQPIEKEYKIWPIVYGYESYNNSLTNFYYFPAVLPLYDEGIERNYSAFLKLFEYYKHQDYVFLKLLWGLYRYERFQNRSVQELAFIYRIVKGPDTNYVEFLEGLCGLGKLEGKPIIKVFFINLVSPENSSKLTSKNEIY